MGDQKNHLSEMVLLSTHNICFGGEIRELIFKYGLLSAGQVQDGRSILSKRVVRGIKPTSFRSSPSLSVMTENNSSSMKAWKKVKI